MIATAVGLALTVRASGFVDTDEKIFNITSRRFLGRWLSRAFWLHNTFVRVESVNVAKETEIELSLMHGSLAGLGDPFLTDSKGNRYRLRNSELAIPDLMTAAYQEIMQGRAVDMDRLHRAQKKILTLVFDPVPTGENVLTLHFDEIYYKLPTVLEINIPDNGGA